MTYFIDTAHDVTAYLKRIDEPTKKRIVARLAQLAEDPFDPQHSKPLHGGQRSARVGGLRIIYRVSIEHQTIAVDSIAPRGQVYRGL